MFRQLFFTEGLPFSFPDRTDGFGEWGICFARILLHLRSQNTATMGKMTISKDDALEIKAVVLYTLTHYPKNHICDVYHIVKAVYMAQRQHLAEYFCPMINDRICAMKWGPVPSVVYDALRIARGDTKVLSYYSDATIKLISDAIEFKEETFTAKELPDGDYISESGARCIDAALEYVPEMTFLLLANTTHGKE